jgi:hypothetical protein
MNRVIDQIGNWNPQLLRELKGRFKPRNLLIASAISLVAQGLPVLAKMSELPVVAATRSSRYCLGSSAYGSYSGEYLYRDCVVDAAGNLPINWRLWYSDVFSLMSILSIFTVLMVGTYLLVSDLDREERRGTLNFIRLSPQTAPGILIGKLLGVPALLYFVAVTALPLHLWIGLSAGIQGLGLLAFYSVLGVSCLFFFSLALLFGLKTTWLGGFQPWLLSGGLFIFLLWTMNASNFYGSASWIQLFCPALTLPYLVPERWSESGIVPYSLRNVMDFKFFSIAIGKQLSSLGGMAIFNYGLWGYWVWQALQRCFHSPSATMVSKRQSYGIVACWTVMIVGCALLPQINDIPNPFNKLAPYPSNEKNWLHWLWQNFQTILSLNVVLFLGLIAALSPHRQTLQDWARYRLRRREGEPRRSLFHDLAFGEHSPALMAIAINLLIVAAILTPWISTWNGQVTQRNAFAGLIVGSAVILLYAVLVQTVLMQRLPKRGIWAIASVGTAIVLPVVILGVLQQTPEKNPLFWLFTVAPWVAVPNVVRELALFSVLAQLTVFAGLTARLHRQIKQAGESDLKRLLKAAA